MSQGFEFSDLKNHILSLEFKLTVIPLTCFELKGGDAVTLSHITKAFENFIQTIRQSLSSKSKY